MTYTRARSVEKLKQRPTAKAALCAGALSAAAVTLLGLPEASAQQQTFHLDRLEVPGAPGDGIALFRPANDPNNLVYGQLAVGYSLRPLRTATITTDRSVLTRSRSSVIQDQLSIYGSVGFELLERVIVGATFPVTLVQTGGNPDYGGSSIIGPAPSRTTTVGTDGPAVGDIRLDLRGTVLRSQDRGSALGAQVSLFAPTGNGSNTNFGGDGATSGLFMVTGETKVKSFVLVANTGIHFRPRNSINDPVNGSGLGVGNEWRWAVGAFLPLKDGKYRIGATIFGQTGIESDTKIIGDTAFTGRNTPIEWQAEGRMKLGPADHYWVGIGAGTLIAGGYGAPAFRGVALFGTYIPILESGAKSPDKKAMRERYRSNAPDRDGDGIPDDIDACPDEPEDHLGNDPNDGCPQPPDRDGDGIPDMYDKCPDEPEDKDGIDDGDGCPETDADNDGIPDTEDACPKEPGAKNADPKKNGCPSFIKVEGNVVRILQQVHFATGSTNILPDSFPMLQEIANLLKANPGIKRMSIEGHTDNRGGADMNKKLSQGRANSVMAWLVAHGVGGERLEAHGYGLEKPIDDNNTDQGRANNRRVEFKILEEEDTNKIRR